MHSGCCGRLAATVLACLVLTGCLDSDFLYGKKCDDQGRCLDGYLCDPVSGTCLRPGDLADGAPDGGDPGPDGTDTVQEGDDGIDQADPYGGDEPLECHCPDCQAERFICVHGPRGPLSTGSPGATIEVRLDGPGYQPSDLLCTTQNNRLIEPLVLFQSGFEEGFGGFERVVQAQRQARAQSILSAGSYGAMLCYNGAVLETAAIDTGGRARLALRYAAVADQLENSDTFEFLITEFSCDDGQNWFLLDVQGDGLRDADWQWYTHLLPQDCDGAPALKFRFQIVGSDYPDDCAYLDDVSVRQLAEPTAGRMLVQNAFEESGGNLVTPDCLGDQIAGFTQQTPDARICLSEEAQNPDSQDPQNRLGVRLSGRNTLMINNDIETNYVPAGSDLVASFFLGDLNLPPEGYANAWYRYRNVWYRMCGVGVDTEKQTGQMCRFVWDRAAIGLNRVQVSFWIPDTADGVEDSHAVALDDFSVGWQRASHDVLGRFEDQGDGRYLATLQSDLPGTAELTCIFYGQNPPLITDGTGNNSEPLQIVFE